MTPEDLSEIKTVIVEAMDERFTLYGFDKNNPIKIQGDMAFLSKLHSFVDSMILKTLAVGIAAVIVGSGLWRFIKGGQ